MFGLKKGTATQAELNDFGREHSGFSAYANGIKNRTREMNDSLIRVNGLFSQAMHTKLAHLDVTRVNAEKMYFTSLVNDRKSALQKVQNAAVVASAQAVKKEAIRTGIPYVDRPSFSVQPEKSSSKAIIVVVFVLVFMFIKNKK